MAIVCRRASASITGLDDRAGNPFFFRCWLINTNIWSSSAGATVAVDALGKAGLEDLVVVVVFEASAAGLLLEQEEKAIIKTLIYNTIVYEMPLCMNL